MLNRNILGNNVNVKIIFPIIKTKSYYNHHFHRNAKSFSAKTHDKHF